MSKDERPTITFEYIKSNDYKVYRIHGAYSSANAHGDLIMSLFSERTAIPRKTTHEITKDGWLVQDPINEEKKKSVIREVLFGISLNPDIARSVGNFFIEQANKLDKENQKEDKE